jgi:hypothetical protein
LRHLGINPLDFVAAQQDGEPPEGAPLSLPDMREALRSIDTRIRALEDGRA